MFAADISNTTLSVHQVGQMGYYSSHARRDANANLKVRFICEKKYLFLNNLAKNLIKFVQSMVL